MLNGYSIANIFIVFRGQLNFVCRDTAWSLFVENEDADKAVIMIDVVAQDSMDYLIEKYSLKDSYCYVFRYESEVFLANQSMDHYAILSCNNAVNFSVLLNHIFYSSVIKYHMVQFHSSLVRWQNQGIMFLGPSGIGKTTQAELWQKCQNADIINGDLVFVQEIDNNFIGWGTPWHGSSSYCLNENVNISAIVILKQEKENHLRRLSGLEMVTEVAKNLFYPNWVENGTELALEVLNHLLTYIPVYELSNRADEESVEILRQTLLKRQ